MYLRRQSIRFIKFASILCNVSNKISRLNCLNIFFSVFPHCMRHARGDCASQTIQMESYASMKKHMCVYNSQPYIYILVVQCGMLVNAFRSWMRVWVCMWYRTTTFYRKTWAPNNFYFGVELQQKQIDGKKCAKVLFIFICLMFSLTYLFHTHTHHTHINNIPDYHRLNINSSIIALKV